MFTDVYMQAFNTKLLVEDIEQIVPVVLARVGYERRKIEAGNGGEGSHCYLLKITNPPPSDEDTLAILIGALEAGIDLVHQGAISCFDCGVNPDSANSIQSWRHEVPLAEISS